MILTVTMNPSVDISYPIDHLKIDGVNRAATVSKTPGGKGLNVTRVLQSLGDAPVATGVLGGYLGQSIESMLEEQGINHHFAHISGETRNSIAILHDNGEQTEILEAGPKLSEMDQQNFLLVFQELLETVDLITLSGSLPQGLPIDFYTTLLALAANKQLPVFLDTSNQYLGKVLEQPNKPTLIKPNLEEINELLITNYTVNETQSLKELLADSLFDGIPFVVLSLGKDGAIARLHNHIYRVTIPTITAKNPVGSGDATIAGFASAYHAHKDELTMLKTGMTTGILNAMENETGKINPEKFTEIYQQIDCHEI